MHNNIIVARGMNATNVSRNGTRHAEFMAIAALLSSPPVSVLEDIAAGRKPLAPGPTTVNTRPEFEKSELHANDHCPSFENDADDLDLCSLYPYGQKLLPMMKRVPFSIVAECVLYVTVEPCVMCASMLRQRGIKKVYFGAVNDKFGGTGGVFSIHANSPPIAPGQTSYGSPALSRVAGKGPEVHMAAPGIPIWYPMAPGEGDGGCVEPGYAVEGGWGRDEAVGLLRRFYVQENGRGELVGCVCVCVCVCIYEDILHDADDFFLLPGQPRFLAKRTAVLLGLLHSWPRTLMLSCQPISGRSSKPTALVIVATAKRLCRRAPRTSRRRFLTRAVCLMLKIQCFSSRTLSTTMR